MLNVEVNNTNFSFYGPNGCDTRVFNENNQSTQIRRQHGWGGAMF